MVAGEQPVDLPVGAQGGIRLLADHNDAGVLRWLPDSFAVQLGGFALMTVVGVALAARAGRPAGAVR